MVFSVSPALSPQPRALLALLGWGWGGTWTARAQGSPSPFGDIQGRVCSESWGAAWHPLVRGSGWNEKESGRQRQSQPSIPALLGPSAPHSKPGEPRHREPPPQRLLHLPPAAPPGLTFGGHQASLVCRSGFKLKFHLRLITFIVRVCVCPEMRGAEEQGEHRAAPTSAALSLPPARPKAHVLICSGDQRAPKARHAPAPPGRLGV